MNQNKDPQSSRSYKDGQLPMCAPLGMSYVPAQKNTDDSYDPNMALVRGTLFPGLDLPFMNVVNKGKLTGTPLGELMALDFVIKELNLYLDTHKDDEEAFRTLKSTLALYEEGKERYAKKYGPLTIHDLKYSDSFNWLCDPWPWDYSDGMEG